MKRGIYKSTRCPYKVKVISIINLTPDKDYVKLKLALLLDSGGEAEKYKLYKVLKKNITHWRLVWK